MSKLLTKTRELLAACDQDTTTIAYCAGVSHPWLMGFKYKRSSHPSVVRIEKLYEYLSGKQLEV